MFIDGLLFVGSSKRHMEWKMENWGKGGPEISPSIPAKFYSEFVFKTLTWHLQTNTK